MRAWTLICCLAVALAASAQDAHFVASRTSAIAHHSAFVHGYLHGYDDGFHDGDLDLQMAHGNHSEDCKRAEKSSGYHHDFGDRHFYEAGFKQGYRVGYADASAGRTFRAVDEAQGVAEPPLPDAGFSKEFDNGFASGYDAGQHQGVADGRNGRTPARATACPLSARPEFCTAYVRAYRMGYSDGYINVARPEVVQAAK